jgi:hypothetical protein
VVLVSIPVFVSNNLRTHFSLHNKKQPQAKNKQTMVATSASIPPTHEAISPIGNRRQLLVRVGSWMKYSWRRSQQSLNSNDDDDFLHAKQRTNTNDNNNNNSNSNNFCCNEDNDDENDNSMEDIKIPKHVQFDEDLLVTEIPTTEEPLSKEEEKEIWFQVRITNCTTNCK